MLMPDVNVLVYAHRADTVQHEKALAWLDELAAADAPFGVSTLVATGFVRVVTGKTVFASKPSTVAVGLDFIDELLSSDSSRLMTPGPEHWKIFSRLCLAARATGKLAADAQHAAVAIESGGTLVTADADFEQFKRHGLAWKHLTL